MYRWIDLTDDITRSTRVEISRYIFGDTPTEKYPNGENNATVLQIFIDASHRAYGATAFLQQWNKSALIMTKTRIAPLKSQTLSQLELMGAVFESRLADHLQSSVGPTETIYWTDSQIVLHLISSSKTLTRFIRNRVNEIHEHTKPCAWRCCSTEDNSADLLTCSISTTELESNSFRWNGSGWLNDMEK